MYSGWTFLHNRHMPFHFFALPTMPKWAAQMFMFNAACLCCVYISSQMSRTRTWDHNVSSWMGMRSRCVSCVFVAHVCPHTCSSSTCVLNCVFSRRNKADDSQLRASENPRGKRLTVAFCCESNTPPHPTLPSLSKPPMSPGSLASAHVHTHSESC